MSTIILVLVVLLMASVLLAPEFINAILVPSVSKELRPPARRLVFVSAVAIFVFGMLMFDSIGSLVREKTGSPGQIQQLLLQLVGLFFFGFGLFACLWPWRFMRICSQRLRFIDERSASERELSTLARVARGFGLMFLLGAAFLLRGWLR
jgi:hypothetical protein